MLNSRTSQNAVAAKFAEIVIGEVRILGISANFAYHPLVNPHLLLGETVLTSFVAGIMPPRNG
jgi:hypothetical protein